VRRMAAIKHYFGLSEYMFRQKSQPVAVYYEPGLLINPHLLACGMSGTGKTFQMLRLLNSAADAGIEIDIMDVHEELDDVRGCVAVKYSQATEFGYNPLVLDTDIHAGGVDVQINFIVKLVKDATPQFGAKQESALRYLLLDVYAASGIRQKDSFTWRRKQMTESMRESMIDAHNFAGLREYYPTLGDVQSYAKRKIISLTIGGDNPAITAFEGLRRVKGKLSQLQGKYAKTVAADDIKKAEEAVAAQKTKCIETYTEFVDAMKTGREMDDVLKYDSLDVLTGVLQRLDNLMMSGGIFKSNPPPFGGARVRCHQIKSISTPQQVMFVKLRLRDIFEKLKHLGPTASGTEVRHIVFLDEAHKYFTDDPDDIINVIAKEGRKFGLALWCASQQPTEFPESFLTNVGAKVLLGIDSSYWKRTMTMMRITEDQLKYIKAKAVIAIKMQKDGLSDPPFSNVIVPNPGSEMGREAARLER
jgi:hypothetical protein